MIKVERATLDLMPEGAKVVFFEQGAYRVHMKAYPIIKEFDGVCCDFEFPEGGGWCTYIPISTGDQKAVAITIMEGWVQYEITDDHSKVHYLYIRTSESEIIFKSILAYKEQYGIIALLK